MNDPRTLHLHPDALFDRPYEQAELNVEAFAPVGGPLGVRDSDDRGITVASPSGALIRIDAFAPGILRIRAAPEDAIPDRSTTGALGLIDETPLPCGFTHTEDGERIRFDGDELHLALDRATGDFTVTGPGGDALLSTLRGGIRFSGEAPEYGGHRALCDFRFEDEEVFGFGGRIQPVNRTGSSIDVFTVKVGLVTGDYGGFPVPFFISARGYGLFLNNPWPHVYFDMGRTDPAAWFFHAPGGDCDLFVIHGPEFGRIVESFTRMTGRIPTPGKWWLGFWCSSQTFERTQDVVSTAQRLRDEGYPCDAMVLDGPWRGGPKFVTSYREGKKYISDDLQWHPEFENGAQMVRDLDALSLRTCLHLNSRSFNQDTADREVASGRLRRHGEEVVPRVTDPESEKFYEGLITPLIKDGTALWWTDHSDRVSGEIREGLPSRNLFGALWNRLLTQIMARNGKPDSICLTRGSGIGGQRYGLPWPGDTRHGIDAFQDDISFCLNAGLAGYALTSYDLAGFGLSRDPREGYASDDEKLAEIFDDENICRRLCQSLFFCPTPRIHNNWCSAPKFPWDCSDDAARLFKQFLQMRYRLTPYMYSWALHSARTGEPILRPLVYHHRLDARAQGIEDEFYLGESLLVAPVTEPGADTRRVYLPEGEWVHLWSDQLYRGPDEVVVGAPLYEVHGLPVFVRAGSFIPWQPLSDSLDEHIPEELEIDLYPGNDVYFALHESAQVTNRLACRRTGAGLRVRLENNTDATRRYSLKTHRVAAIDQVRVDGTALSDERIDLDVKRHAATIELEARPKTSPTVELEMTFARS